MGNLNEAIQAPDNVAVNINTRCEVEQLYIKLGKLSDQFSGELAELFTEDGEFIAGSVVLKGRAAIAEHIQSLAGVNTRHCVMNIDLSIEDGKEISATAVAIALTDRGDCNAIYAVDYKSEFQRTKEVLLFRRHTVSIALCVTGGAAQSI
jgi:hypothetical protein